MNTSRSPQPNHTNLQVSEIRSFLFDFGNVIIDIDIPHATEQCLKLRSPDIAEQEFLDELTELVKKYEVGALTTDLFINRILRFAHRDAQALDVINAWNSMLVGIPHYRLSMLRQMLGQYGIYMLSNTNELHIAWINKYLDEVHGVRDFEAEFFNDIHYSHLIGERKPDHSAFQYVIDNSFVTPEHTLFIDDTAENIETARQMGFQVLLSPPDHEIAEYLKLEGYF